MDESDDGSSPDFLVWLEKFTRTMQKNTSDLTDSELIQALRFTDGLVGYRNKRKLLKDELKKRISKL